MMRPDQNSKNNEEGSPLAKISMNWEVVRAWRTRTSQTATLSQTKWRSISNTIGAPMLLDKVGGEVYCTDVAAVDEGSPRQGVVQLIQKLTEPARHTVGHRAVLCLGTRTGDDILVLQGTRDKVVA
jgi:hypothetical protein